MQYHQHSRLVFHTNISEQGIFKGGALRLTQTALYTLAFLASGVILGIYSYFLAVLADRNTSIRTTYKAIEGISGAAVLYTIAAVLLTCCLGGVKVFAFLGILLDVCFIGGMVAIAVMTRHGAKACKGNVQTPLGNGNVNTGTGFGNGGFGTGGNENTTYAVKYGNACRLNQAVFAVSIIAAFLFLVTAIMQLLLIKHHKKEKAFGPGPSNNYTEGYGKKPRGGLFARKNKNKNLDTELGAGTVASTGTHPSALAAGHQDIRPSHDTGYTGSTVAAPGTAAYDKTVIDPAHHAPHGTHGGYYTQPQGTGVNPYGYENNATVPVHTAGTATNY